MDKWKLLNKAINRNTETLSTQPSVKTCNNNKWNHDNSNNNSIHRFQGFQHLIQSKNLVWTGFCVRPRLQFISIVTEHNQNNDSMNKEKISQCLYNWCQLLDEFDTSQITVEVELELNFIHMFNDLVIGYNHAKSVNYSIDILSSIPIKTLSTTENHAALFMLRICIVNFNHIPIFKQCRYRQHSFSTLNPNDVAYLVYTRENNEQNRVNLKGLLSNKIHGIDNTGNICVWPSENILFHTILHHPTYLHQYFQNKSVLELGGGMTAFCGLALAMTIKNMCKAVIVTDGHPDCVRNQRFCIQMNQNKMDRENDEHAMTYGTDSHSNSIAHNTKSSVESIPRIASHQLRWSIDDENGDLQEVMHMLHDMMSTIQPPQSLNQNAITSSSQYIPTELCEHNNNSSSSSSNNNNNNSSNSSSSGHSTRSVDHIECRNGINSDTNTTTAATHPTTVTNNRTPITASTTYHFDVILACDVLFFSDFHDELVYVLRHALKPPSASTSSAVTEAATNESRTGDAMNMPSSRSSENTCSSSSSSSSSSHNNSNNNNNNNSINANPKGMPSQDSTSAAETIVRENNNKDGDDDGAYTGGVVLLLQPRRGNTMDAFISKASPYFDITIEEDYNTQVTECRKAYQKRQSDTQEINTSGKPFYDEDIHYPVLLVLKLRPICCDKELV